MSYIPIPGCACSGCEGTLFHVPTPPTKHRVRETPGVRYARYKPKVRKLCDECVTEIHRLGVAKAPLPRPVRWRRSTPDGSTHLCETHKELRTEQESHERND